MTKTEPKNYTFIFAFMFGAMTILGGFQQIFYLIVVGLFGLGLIAGTTIQALFPNAFRQAVGGGRIESN